MKVLEHNESFDKDQEDNRTKRKRKPNCLLDKDLNNQVIYSSIDDIMKYKQYNNNIEIKESQKMISTRSGINVFKINEIKEKQREINSKTSENKV